MRNIWKGGGVKTNAEEGGAAAVLLEEVQNQRCDFFMWCIVDCERHNFASSRPWEAVAAQIAAGTALSPTTLLDGIFGYICCKWVVI